jgi:hypothetical protein
MKFLIVFIGLAVVLILGIFIMMKPSILISQFVKDQNSPINKPLENIGVTKQFIMLGSVLTVTGIVGLSVLGFKIYSGSKVEAKEQ